jgi:hypothetical protein
MDIPDEVNENNIEDVLADPDKYRLWMIELLKMDTSEIGINLRKKLKNKEIDDETDMLLRQLGDVPPYNFLVPSFRYQLGLTITNDKECIEILRSFKQYVEEDDINMIDQLIIFISEPEGELDDNIIPNVDLMGIIKDIPIEKIPSLYNCVDYINDILEPLDTDSEEKI